MAKRRLALAAKILPLLAMAALLSWAARERFCLPMTPCADGDTRAYLGPGLSQLAGMGFNHIYGQCFLYPGFLWAILRVSGDFRWITAVQCMAGLATGATLFGAWRQLRGLAGATLLPALIHDLAGAALTAVYLFSNVTIGFERALRPEAIFPLFVTLNIYFNLRFIRERFVEKRPGRAAVFGAVAIFLSVMAWLLKPSFSAMLVLANLPALISLFRHGQSWREKLAMIGVPTVAAIILLILPEARLRAADPLARIYLANSLFSIHADIINDQLADDSARHAQTPYPAILITAAHEKLTEALAEDRAGHSRYWPALGFNPDYLVTSPGVYAGWVREVLGQDREAEFFEFCYWRAVRGRPWQLLGKIFRQFGAFYHWGRCAVYAPDDRPTLARDYQRSAAAFGGIPELADYAPAAAFRARTIELAASKSRMDSFPKSELAGRLLGAFYSTGLLITVFLLLVPALRAGAVAALFLYSYNFGTVLALAIGHTLDVGRYSQYQLAYTSLAQFATLWLILEGLALISRPLLNHDASAGN